jgi:hypothetical protein
VLIEQGVVLRISGRIARDDLDWPEREPVADESQGPQLATIHRHVLLVLRLHGPEIERALWRWS